MRGFGIFGDQNTLVLLDGQRISENEQTPVNWAAIPLDAIERIEILRGSGAVLYGSGATGGTINIITKAPRRGERSATLYGGAGSLRHLRRTRRTEPRRRERGIARQRRSLRKRQLPRQQPRAYRQRPGGRALVGIGRLACRSNSVRTSSGRASPARSARRRSHSNPPAGCYARRLRHLAKRLRQPRRRNEARRGRAGRQLGIPLKGHRCFVLRRHAVPQQCRDARKVWSLTPRFKLPHRVRRLGEQPGSRRRLRRVGFRCYRGSLDRGPAPLRPSAMPRSTLQHTMALSADTSLAFGLRAASRELRRQRLDQSCGRRQPQAHPHCLGDRRAAENRRERLRLRQGGPQLPGAQRERQLQPVHCDASRRLEPQTSDDYEIGLDAQAGPGRYRLALYQSEIDNEIFFDPLTFANRNLPPTRRSGFEVDGRWQFTGGVDLYANYTYAQAEFRSGNFGGISIAGNHVPLVPQHAANAGLGWAFTPRTPPRCVGALRRGADLRFGRDQYLRTQDAGLHGGGPQAHARHWATGSSPRA